MSATASCGRDGPPATGEYRSLVPGVVIHLPAGRSGYRRAFCLELTRPAEVSKATGAVILFGKVVAASGTTTRKRPLWREVVMMPPWDVVITGKPQPPGGWR